MSILKTALLSLLISLTTQAMDEVQTIDYSVFSAEEYKNCWVQLVLDDPLVKENFTTQQITLLQEQGLAEHYRFDQEITKSPIAGKLIYRFLTAMVERNQIKRNEVKKIHLPGVGLISHEARAISQFFNNAQILGSDIDEGVIEENNRTFAHEKEQFKFKVADSRNAEIWNEFKSDLILFLHPQFSNIIFGKGREINDTAEEILSQVMKLHGQKVVMIFTSVFEASHFGRFFTEKYSSKKGIKDIGRFESDDPTGSFPCISMLMSIKISSKKTMSYDLFMEQYKNLNITAKMTAEMRYRSALTFSLTAPVCNNCAEINPPSACPKCPITAHYCNADCQRADWKAGHNKLHK